VHRGNISKFVARDPVLFADYFTHRIKCVMKTVIHATTLPLGGVASDHWYRKEWQVRGATHAHMLLWIRGAPVVGKSSEEEIIRFIEENITCRLPDSIKEPTLYGLVDKYQVHKCTGKICGLRTAIVFIALCCLASCKRNYRDKKGKIASTGCRFLFPRPESKITQLHSGSASVKREARIYIKNYVLARKKSESNINDYNPLLLMALRANMDIQFISSSDKVLESYVVGYTAKGEFANAAQELRSPVGESRLARVLNRTHSL
jgi:hypothetical protein